MTIEHFGLPLGARATRARDRARRRTVDELAGRTIWCATALRRFLGPYSSALEAYLTARRRSLGHGRMVERIAALMPCADVVAAKETEATRDDVSWSSMLAGIVDADRDETVGGRLHPRPAVAAR